MLEILTHIIKRTKAIPNTSKQKQLTSDLVARYSNGNVSLQRGNFITSSELTKKEKIIFSHRFI